MRGGCGGGASRLGRTTGHLARGEVQTDEQPGRAAEHPTPAGVDLAAKTLLDRLLQGRAPA
eukprot:3349601-Alexandrium_andersonii.AAC.1